MECPSVFAHHERIIQLNSRLGSGIVKLIGPACSGKTTSLCRVLRSGEAALQRHRSERGDPLATSDDHSTSTFVYVSLTTCQDMKALNARLVAELDGSNRSARSVGTATVGDSLARAAAARHPALVHVVIDDVGSNLSTALACEVGSAAAQYFTSAKCPKNAVVWLASRADFYVPHAARSAFFGAVAFTSIVDIGETPGPAGRAVKHVAEYYSTHLPMSKSVFAADSRRLMKRADQVCRAVRDEAVIDRLASKPASLAKELVEWFGAPSSEAASATSAASTLGTLSQRMLVVAAFLCGNVFDDGLAVQRRSGFRANGQAAPSGTPHLITITRLSAIYTGLAKMVSTSGAVERPPPASVALHHIAGLESQGALKRAVNNHSAYRCHVTVDVAAKVASGIGLDLFQLLPTGA